MSVTSNASGEKVYKSDYAWGYFKDAPTGSSYGGSYKRTYEWDSRNLLITSSDNTHQVYYTYDANGERTNKYTHRSETLYFNTFWNWHKDSAIPLGQYSKNIYLGTTRLVTKLHKSPNEWPSSQATTANCYYYHSDHLGSAQLITDYKGNEYQRLEYTPYGELWIEKTSSAVNTKYLPYKFTGKERDEETGLYYFGARYLDSQYSRWLSTDPALGDYIPLAPVDDEAKKHNSQLPGQGGIYNLINLNLFHYAANNPVKYIDPDGRIQCDAQGNIIKSYIGNISNKKINYDIYVLFSDKGNPVLGFSSNNKHKKSDVGGELFADSSFIMFPNDMTYDMYNQISESIGYNMSRSGNLETLLSDECSEVSKNDVKKGDIIVHRFQNGNKEESSLFGVVSDVKKSIFGTKIFCERNGEQVEIKDKYFSGDISYYRQNE